MGEPQLAPSRDGSVVLDIGGDVGALVLHVSSDMDGREIDLTPEDPQAAHTHSAVRGRHLVHGVWYAAVYPSLKAGVYTIDGSMQRVEIRGGEVSEVEYSVI
jgi:predicted lipoprotein